MTARVAVYYAPTADDPLAAASTIWLGRDPVTNAPVAQPDIPNIAAITDDARTYGFHATLKPPMRLTQTGHKFREAPSAIAKALKPFGLPPRAHLDVHGSSAMRDTRTSPSLP